MNETPLTQDIATQRDRPLSLAEIRALMKIGLEKPCPCWITPREKQEANDDKEFFGRNTDAARRELNEETGDD